MKRAGVVFTVAIGILAISTSALAGSGKARMDTPLLSCAARTQGSISVTFTAGATGAPAGFSIHWMKAADLAAAGGVWPASESTALCKASFSGNASLSRYDLQPGEAVTVNIGEFLFDNGASTSCPDRLSCGTDWAFRTFAHANNTLQRSDFSLTTVCSTEDCHATCTHSQSYWKAHGPLPAPNNVNEWPATSLLLGSVSYTDLELLNILNQTAEGNGLIDLAHQLIAARLNIANGADGSTVASSVAAADALIGSLIVPPSGTAYLEPSATDPLVTALTNYNEGSGPGHCTELPPDPGVDGIAAPTSAAGSNTRGAAWQ